MQIEAGELSAICWELNIPTNIYSNWLGERGEGKLHFKTSTEQALQRARAIIA